MKSAEEWCKYFGWMSSKDDRGRVREIQADALRWAADQLRPWDRDLNTTLHLNADAVLEGRPTEPIERGKA